MAVQVEINFEAIKMFESVKHFHETFGLSVAKSPQIGPAGVGFNRIRLIQEELAEYAEALAEEDLVGIADALTDLLYVVTGGFVEHGLPMAECFDEVQRSNMSKVGGKIDGAGKFVKPATYSKPDLERVIYGNSAHTEEKK